MYFTDNTSPLSIKPLRRAELKHSFSSVKWEHKGKVCDVVGTVIEASLPNVKLGSMVTIHMKNDNSKVTAEVVGFKDDKALLLPYSSLSGIEQGSLVSTQKMLDKVPVGDFLLGKIVDPFLNPLDQTSLNLTTNVTYFPIEQAAPNPIMRERIKHPIGMGIKSLDALLSLGNGQRMGIMAGSGVGKSVLLGMIARGTSADVNVIGLIGERGREVREFIEKDLGEEGLKRSVVVVSTSDQSPLMKIRAAKVVSSIAEYFSAQGKNVVLMMDSLTRVAMAQREIGLAVGEPPTTKGYTPSVFSLIPKLLERSGPQIAGHGAITALYTVLVDGDDFNEPIADAARSVLDGHIVLSRKLAAKGHYPAIDVSNSISRVMLDIIGKDHKKAAMKLKELISIYEDNLDLLQIGAYQVGTNPVLDESIRLHTKIEEFLKQDINDLYEFETAVEQLKKIVSI